MFSCQITCGLSHNFHLPCGLTCPSTTWDTWKNTKQTISQRREGCTAKCRFFSGPKAELSRLLNQDLIDFVSCDRVMVTLWHRSELSYSKNVTWAPCFQKGFWLWSSENIYCLLTNLSVLMLRGLSYSAHICSQQIEEGSSSVSPRASEHSRTPTQRRPSGNSHCFPGEAKIRSHIAANKRVILFWEPAGHSLLEGEFLPQS